MRDKVNVLTPQLEMGFLFYICASEQGCFFSAECALLSAREAFKGPKAVVGLFPGRSLSIVPRAGSR